MTTRDLPKPVLSSQSLNAAASAIDVNQSSDAEIMFILLMTPTEAPS